MIELLIADVDGTLVTPDKELTERARSAVRNLRAAKIKFAITSGRPPRGMAMLVEPLGLTTPIAGFNGGILVPREQHNVQFPPTVTTDLEQHDKRVVKIVRVSDDLPAVEACAQDLRDLFGDEPSAARSQPYFVDVTHPQANRPRRYGASRRRSRFRCSASPRSATCRTRCSCSP